MFDNQLIALIRSTITAQATTAGVGGILVQQAFQPQQQGVPSVISAFLHKLYDHRLGSPYRADVYDEATSRMVHTELQDYETTFQISVLATQDPKNVSQYTASDICNLIAYILQSSATLEAFVNAGVSVLRVTDVRNPYFTDDRGRNEASPSFDFTLQHKQIVVSASNVIDATTFQILPV